MQRILHRFEQLNIAGYLAKWFLLVSPMAAAVGSIVALFLWLLDRVTQWRWENGWLLYLLPLCGILIYFLYAAWGKKPRPATI